MGIPVFSHILSITIKLDNNTNLNSVSKEKKPTLFSSTIF